MITVICAHSQDATCFDRYREANMTGAAVSDKITVSRDNSILNRLNKLLAYLVKHDPDGVWGQFFADGQPLEPYCGCCWSLAGRRTRRVSRKDVSA